MAVLESFAAGVRELFYEPYKGAVLGPEEFVLGLGVGVKNFLGYTVGRSQLRARGLCSTAVQTQSFVQSCWQGFSMLRLRGGALPESRTVKKSKDFCAAAHGPVSLPHIYPTSLTFARKPIKIYFTRFYIIILYYANRQPFHFHICLEQT